MKDIFVYFGIILFLGSCVAPEYITHITNYRKLESLEAKTVTIVGLDHLSVQNYHNIFHKNFSNSFDFMNEMAHEMAIMSMKKSFVYNAKVDSNLDWKHINTQKSKKSYIKTTNLFKECSSDYLILLDDFKIMSNMINKRAVNDGSMNSGFGNDTNSKTEFIVISGTVQIFDVKSRAAVLEFEVYGIDQVLFSTYSISMRHAKSKLIKNTINFLKNYSNKE